MSCTCPHITANNDIDGDSALRVADDPTCPTHALDGHVRTTPQEYPRRHHYWWKPGSVLHVRTEPLGEEIDRDELTTPEDVRQWLRVHYMHFERLERPQDCNGPLPNNEAYNRRKATALATLRGLRKAALKAGIRDPEEHA